MNLEIVKTLAKKDIRSLTSNVQLWLPMIIVPFVFSVLYPVGMILAIRFLDLKALGNIESILTMLATVDPVHLSQHFLELYNQEQQLLYFLVIYLAAPFFLLIPVMVASVITANSFAGEKERKTLEGLLYTPVSIGELFIGKALAAFVPAVMMTFASFIVYGVLVNSLAYPVFSELIFPTYNWVILIFLIVPLLVLCIIFINIFISAKAKGFQEAYQLGGVVVLPIIGLVIGQATGFLFISVQLLLGVGVGLAVISFVLFRVIKKKMNRYEFLEKMN